MRIGYQAAKEKYPNAPSTVKTKCRKCMTIKNNKRNGGSDKYDTKL